MVGLGLSKRLHEVYTASRSSDLWVMMTDDTTLVHLKYQGQKLQHTKQLIYLNTGLKPRARAGLPRPSLQLLSTSLKMSFVRALNSSCIYASSSASPTVMTHKPRCTAGCKSGVWILPDPLTRHGPTIKDQVISLCVICGQALLFGVSHFTAN